MVKVPENEIDFLCKNCYEYYCFIDVDFHYWSSKDNESWDERLDLCAGCFAEIMKVFEKINFDEEYSENIYLLNINTTIM